MVVEDVLRKVVPEAFGRPVEIFSEYLDIEWASIEKYGEAEAEFLNIKYGSRNIQAIVAAAPQALQFVIAHRAKLLVGVPLVHLAIPSDVLPRLTLPAETYGKSVDLDQTATLDLALRLHPQAKRLFVVLGSGERERAWERRLRPVVDRFKDRLDSEYLIGLTREEIEQRLGALPPRSLVFTPGFFADGAGKIAVPRDSAELIARASSAPVYGPLDTFVGTGVVGGVVTPYETQSEQAGLIVVELLNGRRPAALASSVPRVPMVDARAIARWNIDTRLLPTDTVVRFDEPTVWQRHGSEIAIGIALVLLQTGLIVWLLVERRNRVRTAHVLEEVLREMEIAARAARLSLWRWNESPDRAGDSQSKELGSVEPSDFELLLKSVPPADREALERAVRKALVTGGEFDVEYRSVEPDGTVRWVAARGSADRNAPNRVLGIALDVTERKTAELEAAQWRERLAHLVRVHTAGEMSAAIAHEINQPLGAIANYALAARRRLAQSPPDLERIEELLGKLVGQAARAGDVVTRLRGMVRRHELEQKEIPVDRAVRECIDMVKMDCDVRDIRLQLNLPDDLPQVSVDEIHLQQVVLNLLRNAMEAMDHRAGEKTITIRAGLEGTDKVFVEVADRGAGIAEGDLERVFESFYSTKSSGLGVGLAICRKLIEAHGGSLWAEHNPGGGALFRFTLPAVAAMHA